VASHSHGVHEAGFVPRKPALLLCLTFRGV
jgi:hypothetical protein